MSRSVPVQIVCRGCGTEYPTTVRGSSTRCPQCGRQRYVRTGQGWEGSPATADQHPALGREPVGLSCRACAHRWESRAAHNTRLRCPNCSHSVRVDRQRLESVHPISVGGVQAQPSPTPWSDELDDDEPDELDELDDDQGDELDDEPDEPPTNWGRTGAGREPRPLEVAAAMLRDLIRPSQQVAPARTPTTAPPAVPAPQRRSQRPTWWGKGLRIRNDWSPTYGQVLLPSPAPQSAAACRHCRGAFLNSATYWVISPVFQSGIGLCHVHAEQERYAPETAVHLISWH